MHRRLGIGSAILTTLLLAPVAASAQAIGGTVTDTTGGVLPGVTVEVRSPALIEQVRTVVTDGTGQYLVVSLEAGTYAVTFRLPGFNLLVREGIVLAGEFTANVDAQLPVGSVEETVTVSGQSPVVDIQNVRQQAVMNREVIDSIPSGRYFSNLAVLVPGMTRGSTFASSSQDVGGQSGKINVSYGLHGSDPSDQHITVDGMSMSAWSAESNSRAWLMDGNFEEVTIDHSANSAEIETGGVRINLVPRAGGNTFSSRNFFNFSTQGLQRDNLTSALIAQGLTDANRLKELWQFNLSLGGPVVVDKLWFFVSHTRVRADQFVALTYEDTDDFDNVYVADLSRQAVDDQRAFDTGVRISWQPTPRNKLQVFYANNDHCQCHLLIGSQSIGLPIKPTAAMRNPTTNNTYQVSYTSTITNRLLLEAGLGYLRATAMSLNQPEVFGPNSRIGILELGSGLAAFGNISSWFTRSTRDILDTNLTMRTSLSYVTGSHNAKFGFVSTAGSYNLLSTNNEAGDYRIRTRFGSPFQVDFTGFPVRNVNFLRPSLGIYAQDQWTLDRLTVNAGVRFDYYRTGYPDHNIPPTPNVPVPRNFQEKIAVTWKDVQPRLGVVYDLFGDATTAVKVTANRYGDREGVGWADGLNPSENNNTSGYRFWRDFDGDFFPDCDPLNPAPNGECLTPGNQAFGTAAINTFYDDDWAFGWGKRPSNWEFSAGVQRELTPGMSVNVSYFRRIFTNFSAEDNRAVSPADYDPYCVTVPVDNRLPGGGGNELCGLFDVDPAKAGLIDDITTSADNFGTQQQHWNGVDFTVNARMQNGLLLQGGLSTGKTTTDDCDLVSKLDNPSSLYCHTETAFITDVKLLGAYTLPYDIQIAGTFQSIQGPEILASVNYSRAEVAESLGRPPTFARSTSVQVIEPGTQYGERLYQLDLRVGKIFTFGRARVHAMFDLYNLFNASSVLAIEDSYGAASAGGTEWRAPASILTGQMAKLGVQVDF